MIHYLFWILVLMVSGCSRAVDKTELLGRYEFPLDNMKQEITIGVDGKYTNVFYRDGVLAWSDQGEWTYEKLSGGREEMVIAFAEFRFGIPEYSSGRYGNPEYSKLPKLPDSSKRSLWYVAPEKTFTGVMELCFDPDLYRCFTK
jgi:hypothetical protein